MEDQLISFETAKLAKEKGFNLHVDYLYYIQNVVLHRAGNINPKYKEPIHNDWVSVPTQSLLQKWLRNNHNIHIKLEWYEDGDWEYWLIGDMFSYQEDGEYYSSYEEALEEGLKGALSELKNIESCK